LDQSAHAFSSQLTRHASHLDHSRRILTLSAGK
jgi:hypothetical protein